MSRNAWVCVVGTILIPNKMFLGSLLCAMKNLTPKKFHHKYRKAAEQRCILLSKNTVMPAFLSDGKQLMSILYALVNAIFMIKFARRGAC